MLRPKLQSAAALASLTALSFVSNAAFADTVVLRNGLRLDGQVKLQELGKYVVIAMPDGAQKTVMWDDLKEVELSPAGAVTNSNPTTALPTATLPAVTPGPTPTAGTPAAVSPRGDRTEMAAEANRSGLAASMRHECAEGDRACHEQADLQLKGGNVQAKYEAVEDCSERPGQVCTKQTSGSASKDGLKVGYSKETVDRVTGPKTGASQFGLMANLLIGGSELFTMTGITVGVNIRLLTGSTFPSAAGGSWSGLFIEPTAQLSYMKISMEPPETCGAFGCYGGGETIESNSGAALLGASAGFQYLHFKPLDPKTLRQGGYGFALGAQLGSFIPLDEGDASATYGGAASVLFPSYNPGTGAVRSEQLNLFVLPTTDLLLVMIGGQISFG
jgi:hypothetical protein